MIVKSSKCSITGHLSFDGYRFKSICDCHLME
jgi:hypothetical protein